jgi:nucleoside-diphosphate-sugar epimerase
MLDLARLIFSRAKVKGLLGPDPDGLGFSLSRAPEDDVRVRIPDVGKAGRSLGFRPTRSLLECVDLCLDEFSAGQGTARNRAGLGRRAHAGNSIHVRI